MLKYNLLKFQILHLKDEIALHMAENISMPLVFKKKSPLLPPKV